VKQTLHDPDVWQAASHHPNAVMVGADGGVAANAGLVVTAARISAMATRAAPPAVGGRNRIPADMAHPPSRNELN
jgi:hypothetical protein